MTIRARYSPINYDNLAGKLDHGLLLGLTPDDDHTQYLLADGTRALAGNWSLGGQDLTNGANLTINTADTMIDLSGIGITAGGTVTYDNILKVNSYEIDTAFTDAPNTGAVYGGFIRDSGGVESWLSLTTSLATKNVLRTGADGDARARFTLTASGVMSWGDGTNAADTNLYKSAANKLKTDDGFECNALNSIATIVAGTGITSTTGNITATAGNIVATAGQVSAGTYMSAVYFQYDGSGTSANAPAFRTNIATADGLYGNSGSNIGIAYAGASVLEYTPNTWNFQTKAIANAGAITGTSLALGGGAITNATNTNWDLAYGWGDHASGGYAQADQTMYIGTTAVAINRGSGTLNLAGIGTLGAGAITGTSLTDGTTLITGGDYTSTGTMQIGSGTRITPVHFFENTSTTNNATQGLTIEQLHATGDIGVHIINPDITWTIGIDAGDDSLAFSPYGSAGASTFELTDDGNVIVNAAKAATGGKYETFAKHGADTVLDIFTAALVRSGAAPGAGMGIGYLFKMEGSVTAGEIPVDAGKFEYIWEDPTVNQEDSKFNLKVMSNGSFASLLTVSGANGVYIGDGGTTHYSKFASDGELTLHGNARVYRDMWIDAGGIKAPGSKPATAVAHGTLETPVWQFADAIEANQNSISFAFKIPNDMDTSEAPTISVGWSTNDTNEDTCEWQLEYLWTAVGENTSAAADETLYADDAAPAQADGLVVTTFTGIDAPGATDVCFHARITRLSAAAAGSQTDDIADTVELHGVCMQYTSNKLGTAL